MKVPSRRDYKGGHFIELLHGGDSYFNACEKLIDEATQYVHFQTYIVDDDETGRRFVNALVRAARRGVKVYFLIDAFGGSSFSSNLIKQVEDAGILFRKFSPGLIKKGFQFSLRLHHKVLLVDGTTAIIGGMNVANRYRGTPDIKQWLDFALIIKGPECAHVLFIVKRTWNRTFISKKDRAMEAIHNLPVYDDDVKIKVIQNNWYRNKIEILKELPLRSQTFSGQNGDLCKLFFTRTGMSVNC